MGQDHVQRIWRREGLKVPQKQRPRGRLWRNDGSCVRLRPERANHVWSNDFVKAMTHDGRSLRLLVLLDEYIQRYSDKTSHPTFIPREGQLWTFINLRDAATEFGTAIEQAAIIHEDAFDGWFSDPDRGRWAIELLNFSLKENAWGSFLRQDKLRRRYFSTPWHGQPKKNFWRIGGKWSKHEITARHMVTRRLPNVTKEKIQSGWRHQACQASFVLMSFGLFLRLEPTLMLTKADGKTPRGGPRVGPILSHWLNQERNGQILRFLRKIMGKLRLR